MMRYIKGYLAMVPYLYRFFVYAVFPLVTVSLYCFFYQTSSLSLLPGVGAVMIFLEVLADHTAFAGMAAKRPKGYGYFRTSRRGLPLLKKILLVDDARRLLWACAVMTACYFAGNSVMLPAEPGIALGWVVNGWELAATVLLVYSLITTAVGVTRMFEVAAANLLAAYAAMFLAMGCLFLFYMGVSFAPGEDMSSLTAGALPADFASSSAGIGWMQGLLFCGVGTLWAAGATVAKNRLIIRRIGGNYYDGEN